MIAGAAGRWYRVAMILLVYGAILAAGHWGGKWLIGLVGVDPSADVVMQARRVMIAGIVLYIVLLAIPFMPGMEISLALLAAFGHKVAFPIYLATIVALAVSFLIGRLVPVKVIANFFRIVGLQSAQDFVASLAPMSAEQRLGTLISHAPRRIVPTLLKHRYIAIAVLLNVPGNALIGGGGGIALLAGVSGLFSLPRYLAIVALAVAPVPLAVMLIG